MAAVGPIAFVIVFMLVPLAAAVFAGAFFATVGLLRVLDSVPAGVWLAVVTATGLALATRLWVVVRTLRSEPR